VTIEYSLIWEVDSRLPSTILFLSISIALSLWNEIKNSPMFGQNIPYQFLFIVIQSSRFFLLSFPHSCNISVILCPLVLVKKWTSKYHYENLITCRSCIALRIIFLGFQMCVPVVWDFADPWTVPFSVYCFASSGRGLSVPTLHPPCCVPWDSL